MDFPRKDDSTKKRTRKRSYTRKASLSRSFINMAEARREIANALHLHRSSSSPSPSPSPVKISCNPTVLCSSSSHNQLLTDSMPIPEPTAPAVPTVGVLEVEWFDNVSPSYSWWLGFLDSLDGKKEERKQVLGPCLGVEKSDSDGNDGDQNPFTDEWVIFPVSEERGGEQLM